MRRGLVFTMDATFALAIAMILAAAALYVFEASAQDATDQLYLARLARDVYEINYGGVVTLPAWIGTGAACSGAPAIAVAEAVVYTGNGGLSTVRETVCLK